MGTMNEILGNQAYLEILDYKADEWDNLVSGSSGSSLSAKGTDLINTAKDKLKGNFDDGKPGVMDAVKNSVGIDQRGIKDGLIKVQYNPTSMTFTGSTRADSGKRDEKQRQNIETVPVRGNLSMSVELLFDSDNILDTSVQDEMNLLLVTVKKSKTKEVRFSWGKMEIQGKLTAFSGEYTMFYPNGLPQAGKIRITITAQSEPSMVKRRIEKMAEEKPDIVAE